MNNKKKYYFATNDLNIAAEINEFKFLEYSKFIKMLSPLNPILDIYKIVQLQYKLLNYTPYIVDNLPIMNENSSGLAYSSITIYIIVNRIFIDNCKSFRDRLPSIEINKEIQHYEKLDSEENLRVLRNYAVHTSSPITGLNLMFESTPKSSTASMDPIINKSKMAGDLNRHDQKVIKAWVNGELHIMPELHDANITITGLYKSIIRKFIDKKCPNSSLKLIKSDKKIWTNTLLPSRTRGVFKTVNNSCVTAKYIDSLLLKTAISYILKIK